MEPDESGKGQGDSSPGDEGGDSAQHPPLQQCGHLKRYNESKYQLIG